MSSLPSTVNLPINPPDEYARRLNQAISDMARRTAVVVNGKADSRQSDWVALTLLNGWVAGRAVAVLVGTTGQVNIRGTVGGGTMSQAIAVLPAGARPPTLLTVTVVSATGFGAVDIYPTGEIIPTTGSPIGICLDGITFPAS